VYELALPLLIALIALALLFDYLNGLHDAANAIATVVATRLLSPVKAVAFAAVFNFAAYFLTIAFPSLHAVADTIGKGLVEQQLITPAVVFGALVGAMFWNVVTWLKGIPSSSSHALVGGIVGAGVAHAGFTGILWTGLNSRVATTVAMELAASWRPLRKSKASATPIRPISSGSASSCMDQLWSMTMPSISFATSSKASVTRSRFLNTSRLIANCIELLFEYSWKAALRPIA
jgi:hypothetical protein